MNGIEVRNLSKTYDGRTYALRNVNIMFPERGILSIIGRNGAGKTTLIRILATELMPTSGSASVGGIDVVAKPAAAREIMAIVPQEARTIPWMTARQQVFSYLLYRGFPYSEAKERAVKSLKQLGLQKYTNKLSRLLSGGTKRKVMVATVLASEARVIFLDEPTTGLDPISRRELWQLLNKLKKEYLIVLTTHYLEEAEYLADTIAIMESGRIVAMGSMDELRKRAGQQYSVRVMDERRPKLPKGVRVVRFDGGYQVLTDRERAFAISNALMHEKARFSTNPVSLEDLFYYFAKRSINEDTEEQGDDEW
jgi:ABC-2 type transport system ATP-binding protein